MSTISHEPSTRLPARRSWSLLLSATEMWAAISIVVIWVAVLGSAVWGPNIVDSTPGGNSSTVPSAVAVALFACIATWPVAIWGFGRRKRD